MKKLPLGKISLPVIGLLILLAPLTASSQTEEAQTGPPPIAAPLVREGDLAVKLALSLGISTTDDEIEAESRLADAGILPRNGWIADYPVTPDIVGELNQAVGSAADAGKVSFGRDEALRLFNDVLSGAGLSMTPYSPSGSVGAAPPGSENYPNPAVVNNYYYSQGPPVMTCYTPPAAFYPLYVWVPFPFWWSSFWFPGFFVLHDFHKTVIVNTRVVFVSNHFRDVRIHRVFRIDPAARFQGRTFGGIGAPRTRGTVSTGVPGSERRIFNNGIPRTLAPGIAAPPRSPSGRTGSPPSSRGGRSGIAPAPRGERTVPMAPSGAVITPPAETGTTGPSPRRGEGARTPFRDGGGSPGGFSGGSSGRELRR